MKTNMVFTNLLFAGTLVLLSFCANAQTLEEMQKLYPGKTAVFSNVNREVEISFSKGVPYAKATEVSEMLILDDKANGIYNKDKVYHSSFNELKKVEAYTSVPDGNNMKKMKVSEFKTQSSPSQGIFYDDVKETAFDYPKIVKGSVTHVETEHYNKDIHFISPFYFSSYLPVVTATFSITFPEDMDVKYIIKNDAKNKITVTENRKGRKKRLEFTATGINNNEYFSDAVAHSYYAQHVIVYVSQYTNDDGVVPVYNTVNELYKWNSAFLKNVNITPSALLKQVADSICKGKTTDLEKAGAIYRWVQNHIKYVAFEEGLEGFVPRQAADVCSKRYGDCKDMASLLTALLKTSGLNAYFTWIGTRSIPYSYTEVPLPITDNHMISAVKIDNQWIFLDATDPNCIFGFPTSSIQDKQALIGINPEKHELVKVPVVAAIKNVLIDSTFLTIEKKLLKGFASVDYLGYFGSDMYTSLLYNKGDDERVYARRRMAKGSNKFIMNDYKISFPDSLNKTANIRSNFDIPDYVKSIDDEIYINLNLEKIFSGTPIDTVKRKMAIENDYLFNIKQVHVLKMPAGYTVEHLPKNISVSNKLVDFSIEYKQINDQVMATQNFVIKTLYIEVADFSQWNDALLKVSPAYKEEIVLKKK
jgi:transglutaminase-like putative cysteine protease